MRSGVRQPSGSIVDGRQTSQQEPSAAWMPYTGKPREQWMCGFCTRGPSRGPECRGAVWLSSAPKLDKLGCHWFEPSIAHDGNPLFKPFGDAGAEVWGHSAPLASGSWAIQRGGADDAARNETVIGAGTPPASGPTSAMGASSVCRL
jgi:hypothetical protein